MYGKVKIVICFLLLKSIDIGADSNVSSHYNVTGDLAVTPLIVGGQQANRSEFPWLVWLKVDGSVCGGSLIEMDVVLTAAHCIYGKTAKRITVHAGDHNINVHEGTEQTAYGRSVKWHEKYVSNENSKNFLQNDVGLIKLDRNFTKTKAVQTIALPPVKYDIGGPANPRGQVAGWGTTNPNIHEQHPILMKVSVPIIRNVNNCPSSYVTDKKTQFCAGSGGKDSCFGDSGGAFICDDLPGKICGIVSGGRGCADPRYPGMYQKVSEFVPWIIKHSDASSPFVSKLLVLTSLIIFNLLR